MKWSIQIQFSEKKAFYDPQTTFVNKMQISSTEWVQNTFVMKYFFFF